MIRTLLQKYKAKILSCPNKKATASANLIVALLSTYGASLSIVNAIGGSVIGIVCAVILVPMAADGFYSWWLLRKQVKHD